MPHCCVYIKYVNIPYANVHSMLYVIIMFMYGPVAWLYNKIFEFEFEFEYM